VCFADGGTDGGGAAGDVVVSNTIRLNTYHGVIDPNHMIGGTVGLDGGFRFQFLGGGHMGINSRIVSVYPNSFKFSKSRTRGPVQGFPARFLAQS
jgi:hypothetical protein